MSGYADGTSSGALSAEYDPAVARQWAVKHVGGGLMLAGAVLVAGVTVYTDVRGMPFPPLTRGGNYVLSGVIALLGIFLLRTSRWLPTGVANAVPSTAAILIGVPASAEEAPVELGPLLLTWPVAFSAAVLAARVAWVTVGVAGAVLAIVLGLSRGADGVAVWIEAVASFAVICWMVVRVQTQSLLLRRMLADLARTDPLTGLLNRRGFDEALAREHARNRRGGWPVALLLVDIDHFKLVNDSFGHRAGDIALRRLSTLLGEMFRPTDVVGRIGGEEFAVLIPDCLPHEALRRAYELCDTVRDSARGWEHAITVSVGVAAYPETAPEPVEMLAQTDTALYAAKQAGRDRVSQATPAGPRLR